ncbi:hypothetical protein ACFFKH_07715 [Micromonospora marina]|uniref:hypothetical protein n=1 Tax=Micromonospora marina TaxID=307120 RepID=UPI000ABE3043|nr:hypothetical protein [Micromonospora marina]
MLTDNFRATWDGAYALNQADHIACGRATMDAVCDAGNRTGAWRRCGHTGRTWARRCSWSPRRAGSTGTGRERFHPAGRPVSRTPVARPAEGAGRAGPVPDQGII